jgi:glutamate/tyrosine decarboxylase-like PLP-dependent enzyme
MAPRRQQTRPVNLNLGELRSTSRDATLALAGRMHDLVREHPDFEVLHEPGLGPYCFRYVPNDLAERQEEPEVRTQLDRLNLQIVAAVRRGGAALVAQTRLAGRASISASVCSHGTTEEDIDEAFEAVARWGRLLHKTHPVCYPRPAETEAL